MDNYETFLRPPHRGLGKAPSLEMQKLLREMHERMEASSSWASLSVSHSTIEPEVISDAAASQRLAQLRIAVEFIIVYVK